MVATEMYEDDAIVDIKEDTGKGKPKFSNKNKNANKTGLELKSNKSSMDAFQSFGGS